MGGGPWYGFFLQSGAKSKVNEASQKRSLEFVPYGVFNISVLVSVFSLHKNILFRLKKLDFLLLLVNFCRSNPY